MHIIHLVSSICNINFGIWNAATFGSFYLKNLHGVTSELWICNNKDPNKGIPDIDYLFLNNKDLTPWGFRSRLSNYNPKETVIVTHGAWLQPTRLGFLAKMQHYRWVYLPHGMHEKWESGSSRFKKWVCFNLIERPMARKATAIRAVSDGEKKNLEVLFKREIDLIFNGVILNNSSPKKAFGQLNFLFMARLQRKKGLIFLVKAWAKNMYEVPRAQLIIAGPDEGELEKIQPYLKNNIYYIGPVYGKEKEKLLQDAHYYLLPSFSEGFPTSVVEAMGYGAIPIISKGCNFTQVFTEMLGYEVKSDEDSIAEVLRQIVTQPFDEKLSQRNIEYIKQHHIDSIIGEQLYVLYNKVLQKRK
jgi:glycosyltransferase involved in cell wall biosynthesis